MRFPLALTARIAGHIIGKKIRGVEKFATVLQLEPLHTCNLTCTGCGRIREYSQSLKDIMPLVDCLGAAAECEAPMVSICGGEPLIYPHIEDLVAGLLAQKRIVYICTNGVFMRKKMRDHLAAEFASNPARTGPKIEALVSEELLTPEQAAEIRGGKSKIENWKAESRRTIAPSRWLYWNVHLDSTERTHDLIVEREGVFKECIAAIRMAKILGFQVATNTTVYRETDMREVGRLFDYLSWLGVDGHTISPGYDYDAAKEDMRKRLGLDPQNFFLTREMTKEKFKDIRAWGEKYNLFGTPIYLDFLAGKRDLTCSAWAIPTRNVRGWKGPLLPDDRRPPRQLPRPAGKDPVGKLRGRGRQSPRPALRKLHGPLRLRTQRHPRPRWPAGRYLGEHRFQFRKKARPPDRRGLGGSLRRRPGRRM